MVGFHGDFEGDLRQGEAVIGVWRLIQYDGLTNIHIDLAHRSSQAAKITDKPAQRFGAFAVACLLGGVLLDISDQVVADGNRNDVNVSGISRVAGFQHVFKQPIARRH